jgi:hypothetical protein
LEPTVLHVGKLSTNQIAITPKVTADTALKLVSIAKGTDASEMDIEYCVDCFKDSTIISVIKSLERIARAMVAKPTQKVSVLISCVSSDLHFSSREF